MTTDTTVNAWLQAHGYGKRASKARLSGGCINHCYQITTDKGYSFFLKTHTSPLPGMFQAEASGLRALANTGAIDIPEIHLASEQCLLLAYYEPTHKADHYWSLLGEQLARLHSHTQNRFGFDEDNYIGLNPQKNTPDSCGFNFYIEQRLLFQGKMAKNNGLIDNETYHQLELVCDKLDRLIPLQNPSLIHGDLWSGNIITNPKGLPALIDPATYYGWPEAELAMTKLFGGFPPQFYEAYLANSPIGQDWENRADLYNLYPLLNHLNLFGQSYLSQVKSILSFYA